MRNLILKPKQPGISNQELEKHFIMPRYLKPMIEPSPLQMIRPMDYEHQALDPMGHNPSKPVNYKAFKVLKPKKF